MGWHSDEVPKDLRGDTVCSEYLSHGRPHRRWLRILPPFVAYFALAILILYMSDDQPHYLLG